MDRFIEYDTTAELHKELTNITLLCLVEISSYFYCYCGEEFGECDLCKLMEFLANINDEKLMDGVSSRKFLQINYNNREKLEEFSLKILPFFQKMEMNNENCLDFFQKRYRRSMVNSFHKISYYLTLEEIIENEKEMVDANP